MSGAVFYGRWFYCICIVSVMRSIVLPTGVSYGISYSSDSIFLCICPLVVICFHVSVFSLLLYVYCVVLY